MEARTPYWMISEKWGRIILRSLKGQLQDEMGSLAGDVFMIGETWFRYVVTAVTGCFWQIRCGYGFIIPEDPSYSRRWDEGGDRDDNPRVTPEITRDFCLLASMMAANLYYSQIEDLTFALYVVMQWWTSCSFRWTPQIFKERCKTLYRVLGTHSSKWTLSCYPWRHER